MEVDVAQDSDRDPDVVKQAENLTPTFEEITLNSSLGSQENLQDYMDDSLLESLNKTEPELNQETMSVTSSDTNQAVTNLEDDLPSSPQLPGKYNRSQSCASNISNQSKHKISWGQVNKIPDKTAPGSPESAPVVARKSGEDPAGQKYVWEVWPISGSQVRLSNKIPGQDDELPGGDREANIKKISPDEPDGKIKKDVNGNGTINNVAESSKKDVDIERKITTKYENFNASSLQRHTSKSSLASIKSRIMRGVTDRDPKKTPEATAIRVFVIILFCFCFGIVVAAHLLYNQHIGEVKIFARLRLEDDTRSLVILDQNDSVLLAGHLSVNMPHHLHAYSCLPNKESQGEPVKCLEWPGQAIMKITEIREEEEAGGVICHRVVTQSLSKEISPCDCWPVGGATAPHWYGGGESLVSSWPLGRDTLNMTPFVTGDEQRRLWGNVIRKFFINSKGISINVDTESPLSVSLGRELCFQASYSEFPYYYHRDNLPSLNYTICTGANIQEVYQSHLAPFWEGHKNSDMKVLADLLSLPLWEVALAASSQEGQSYTLPMIKNYIARSELNSSLSLEQGYLLLDYHWQHHMGDFTFHRENFPQLSLLRHTVSWAKRKLAITINPFVSVESEHFREGVQKKLFVMERNSTREKFIPALTWFKDVPLAALLDITNQDTVAWLQSKLTRLVDSIGGEVVFYLDPGNTFHTPHHFTFAQPLYNPDLYKDHFMDACMSVVKVIGVSGASSKRPKAPAFVWMTPQESSWSSLQSIIPNILHLGVIGYPFVNPGPIGGSPAVGNQTEPSMELFIRWWQLATFLPQTHFLTPPVTFRSSYIPLVEKKLRKIKKNIVNPLLRKFAREAMERSLPIIRPLWMVHPTDERCLTIKDQFLVGDSLLVAPVLERGKNTRNVFLPSGPDGADIIWKQDDGRYYAGGQWLNGTVVPLDRILYYERQAEGARPGDTVVLGRR